MLFNTEIMEMEMFTFQPSKCWLWLLSAICLLLTLELVKWSWFRLLIILKQICFVMHSISTLGCDHVESWHQFDASYIQFQHRVVIMLKVDTNLMHHVFNFNTGLVALYN
jgi:hypothetical protein